MWTLLGCLSLHGLEAGRGEGESTHCVASCTHSPMGVVEGPSKEGGCVHRGPGYVFKTLMGEEILEDPVLPAP